MPISCFRIFPEYALVYARYEGHVSFRDVSAILERYLAHPDSDPAQHHLVDMTGFKGFDDDVIGIMKAQAAKTEVVAGSRVDPLCVYLAPNKAAQIAAERAAQCWRGNRGLVVRIAKTGSDALYMLGLEELTLAELRDRATET